jgi:hypothetical protein
MTDYDETDIDDDGESRLSDADREVLAGRMAGAAPRDAAGYERSGLNGAARYGVPGVVTRTMCRRKECRKAVDVTETGLFTFTAFNAHLVKTGQEPIRADEWAICDECRLLLREHVEQHGRRVVDKMAAAVRTLRDGGSPEEERQAIECLDRHDNERAAGAPERSATAKYWLDKAASKKRGNKGDW